MQTTSSSSAGLPTAELGTNPDKYSLLAARPPPLASTRKSTTTTMSTAINGIYIVSLDSLPKHQRQSTSKRSSDNIRGQQQVRYYSWFINYIQELSELQIYM
eukprot:1393114-Amphidinium_carterae.1